MTESILAPYAASPESSRGRKHPEPEHPFRNIYQRDRDRVIHSTAFRRLEYKTQVFVNREGDHYRTRLTHTMEVSQISRTIARALNLNEDLTEAIALAHDLGHTPFGHSGEEAMHDLMSRHGGFEHNRQGLRVVDLLEQRYAAFPGLNLSHEVREAFFRHNHKSACPEMSEFEAVGSALLEAQATVIADEIAYDNHDIDDGLYSGILQDEGFSQLGLWRLAIEPLGDGFRELSPAIRRAEGVRRLINILVTDVIETTRANLERLKIRNIEDVRACGEPIVALSPEIEKLKLEQEKYLFEHLYRNYRVMRMAKKSQRFLRELFNTYVTDPGILPTEYQERIGATPLQRVVCDYIAGMTDRYAEEEYKKLFQPFNRE
jgi:dGTPase